MNQPIDTTPTIRLHVVPVSETPFQDDLFDTKQLADKLLRTLKLLKDGGAIAIDSPWGSGKTWFAKNWKLYLDQGGFTTVYVDAFAMDYVDDPFIMIAGELLSVAKKLKSNTESSLLEAGAKLGKALLPVGTKVVTSVAARWLVGEQGAEAIGNSFDKAVDELGGLAEKQVEKTLQDYESEKASAFAYKEKIREFASSQKHPIVVLIDELDRCRPDFAIKTLERIKHFFEVPGVVFVLLVNGKQLAASIRGAYGSEIDAETYMRKFLIFSVALPKRRSEYLSNDDLIYCRHILRAYGFQDKFVVEKFAEQFGAIASSLRFQYRDIERGCALYAIAQPVGSSAPLVAWVIALKLWRPDLFEGVMHGEHRAHTEIVNLANDTFGNASVVRLALELHKDAAKGFNSNKMSTDDKDSILSMVHSAHKLENVFPMLCRKVNLNLR